MSIDLTQCAKLTVRMTLWVRHFVFCRCKTKGRYASAWLFIAMCVSKSPISKDKNGSSDF